MSKKSSDEIISVGEKIRMAREGKNISLDVVANETGFSTEYLEKIETNATIPAVGTILQIARALDIDSAILLKEQETEVINRISASEKRTDNYAYKTLTPGVEKKHLKAFQVTIDPLQDHSGVGYQHEGEEFVYVLSGRIEVVVGENINVLNEGDSLHFNSGIKHNLKNLSDRQALLIVVIYVP
ncbi:Transcriptional regulator, XRE family [uncultured Desulfobacterium sp.]|uniref:Transcriptional regulator, XRE family n=1 Tax=uncultured Desulfobacterium sp. TaxID=201089 RepID=A0A445MZL8_9BACT|nr:Transcriptional regulator, XRE family [uncultured Desulfobacterium sp.]